MDHELKYSCKTFALLTKQELYDILLLRQEVFVVEQYCAFSDIDGLDPMSYHVLAYDGDTLVAAGRFFVPQEYDEKRCVLGRLVVKSEYRGKGEGHDLVRRSFRFIKEFLGAKEIKITAQAHLLAFYQGLGFELEGDKFYLDGIPHYTMLRNAT